MKSITDIIPGGSILPVCTFHDREKAIPLARTLKDSGINIIEITLRTENAFAIAEEIIKDCKDMQVGIGTIADAGQLYHAKEIGAQFCVSPGMTERLVITADELQLPYLPGVSTVSEVMIARESGLRHFKFFPAELSGGEEMLSLFRQLFPDVLFCPTGGVNQHNYSNYLNMTNVFCVGGSWITPEKDIESGNWQHIAELIRQIK